MVEQWNSDGGTVKLIVEQCGGTLEQCGGTVEQCGGTVEQ